MFTRLHAALIIGTLLTGLDQMDAAVIKALSVSFTDVSTAIGLAQEGDTVVVPAGSASWTSTLRVTKGITLQGQSTVSGAGTQNASATDATNIINNAGSTGLINVQLTPTQHFRLTGLTFSKGTGNGTVVTLSGNGPGPHMNMEVDHCHFNDFPGEAIDVGGWTYGVADHNYMHTSTGGTCFVVNTPNYNGGVLGHGAWADYPWFGTDKFFFIEDNTMKGDGSEPTSGNIDSLFGGRLVVRHNDFTNCRLGWHGTEGAYRGTRAVECYANVTHWSILMSAMNRSGTVLYHDNTWDGMKSQSGNAHGQIVIFREYAGVGSDCPYAYADGTGPFDSNDTEGNGTYVRGHAPYLYASGSVTGVGAVSAGTGTFTDSTKNWTPNQWAGFGITQTNSTAPSYKKGSYITSNTANTITYIYYDTTDRGPILNFAVGDTYEIHKLLVALDQVGRGKGDLLSGTGPITNTVTGGQGWPQQALEPAMSWNNVYSDGTAYGFTCSMPSVQQGRDYYNLGKSLATNGAPAQVTGIYTATLNGVAYTGPYTYPHPLTAPAPPSNLAIVNSP